MIRLRPPELGQWDERAGAFVRLERDPLRCCTTIVFSKVLQVSYQITPEVLASFGVFEHLYLQAARELNATPLTGLYPLRSGTADFECCPLCQRPEPG
jgi:hypothetical protein